uniref:Uncharacterized protein n=1 Tax=Rhizophora mucronata TaxID=61149 RepID=A0A2P2IRC7_RHIMU
MENQGGRMVSTPTALFKRVLYFNNVCQEIFSSF